MLKQTLENLVSCKQNLKKAQEIFVSEWKAAFSFLWSEDVDNYVKELDNEFDYFLSSCLKFKSTRIVMPASNFFYGKMVLTQNPGLKAPYFQSSSVFFTRAKIILPTGDIDFGIKDEIKREKKILSLSVLRNNKAIRQEKLDLFLNLLQKSIDWNKKKVALITRNTYFPYYDSENIEKNTISRENYKIILYSRSFSIKFGKYMIESDAFCHYPGMRGDGIPDDTESKNHIEILSDVLKNLPQITADLNQLEERKKKLVISVEELLKELKKVTNGFKLLKRIV